MKFASLFTGGDLAGEGARMAGLVPIWGVEYDQDIAAIAELNGTKIIVSKVQDVDFSTLESPDWLHMSPPCINASVAKTDAGEAPEDIEMAQGCIRAIQHFKSPVVSLENVWGYRNFESFQMIYAELSRLGYQVRFWHLCAADYGVAQTRKRLILVASLRGTPKRPAQTHTKEPQPSLFGSLPRWIGWYEAIEDLLPTLPESKFAEWQLIRLQDGIGTQMVGGGNTNREVIDSQSRPSGDPMFTVSIHSPGNNRAFLMRSQNVYQEGGNQVREANDAAMTITQNEKPRAFLVHNNDQRTMPSFVVDTRLAAKTRAFLMPGSNTSSAEPREPREPSMTIGDTERVGNIPRAFIVNESSSLEVRSGDEPAASQVASERNLSQKAFIVDGKPANYAGDLRIVDAEDPSPTATAMANQHPMRAWLSQGKVVALTVRALARLQSIPDSYQLPEKNALGCRIVGNAVPPLLMCRIIEAQDFTTKGQGERR